MHEVICAKCGVVFTVKGQRASGLRCQSCRAKKATVITYNGEKCYPWHGDFDQYDHPMLDGQMFMPGTRICGHKDCCNPQHIEKG